MELLVATHSGMTTEAFKEIVSNWIAQARHPRFNRPYTQLICQPMVEVLIYLRANGFKTYIVSGDEQEFMRQWTEETYGIPSEQVVGTQFRTELKDGALVRLSQLDSLDDGPGKPVNIGRFIGKRPIAAFRQLGRRSANAGVRASGRGARLAVLVHHTDAEREYSYDRNSNFGRLDKALDEAKERYWVVIDMKLDWKTIFPSPR